MPVVYIVSCFARSVPPLISTDLLRNEHSGLVVADRPMVLQCASSHGGRTMPRSVVKHYYNHLVMVIVVHRAPGSGRDACAINSRFIVTDVYGINGGSLSPYTQMMEDHQCRAGAPAGDPSCVVPTRTLLLLVNRQSPAQKSRTGSAADWDNDPQFDDMPHVYGVLRQRNVVALSMPPICLRYNCHFFCSPQ